MRIIVELETLTDRIDSRYFDEVVDCNVAENVVQVDYKVDDKKRTSIFPLGRVLSVEGYE